MTLYESFKNDKDDFIKKYFTFDNVLCCLSVSVYAVGFSILIYKYVHPDWRFLFKLEHDTKNAWQRPLGSQGQKGNISLIISGTIVNNIPINWNANCVLSISWFEVLFILLWKS